MSEKHNTIWIDYVRVLATFGVVLLHSSASVVLCYNTVSKRDWWIANIYDSLTRISVPLFFMISGYLLLEKTDKLSIFFQKRFNKVLIPLVVWSIIYIFWNRYYMEPLSQLSLLTFCRALVVPVYYHLWFLYAIIGLYLLIPVLRIFIQRANIMMQLYYVGLWLLMVSVIPFLRKVLTIESSSDLITISGYSGYLVLGLLLGKYAATAKTAIITALMFIMLLCFTAVGTYILTDNNGGVLVQFLYLNKSPNVIFMSASAYLFLKYIFETYDIFRHRKMQSIIHSLSGASFGIYLIHPILFTLLRRGTLGFTISETLGNSIYSIPFTTTTVFVISYLIVSVIRKIPLLKKITP